jgi:two-component system, sensor histidine kinase
MVAGYHDSGFYSSENQKDIDGFILTQKENVQEIEHLKLVADKLDYSFVSQLEDLISSERRLVDSVLVFKGLYFEKGFRDFGAEGRMREYAHELEESNLIPELEVLRLRRLEKDYLLRGDSTYWMKFNQAIDRLIEQNQSQSNALETLQRYKASFNGLVFYSSRLGITRQSGLYSEITGMMNQGHLDFVLIEELRSMEIDGVLRRFNTILLSVSLVFIILVVLLSIYLSSKLSRDVQELNRRIFVFIRSRFKESDTTVFSSDIIEVQRLNRLFVLMKKNLRSTLGDLQKSYADAQRISDYKSEFLANMSHEMRTPLNGVIGMTTVMQRSDLTDEQKEYANTIQYSANHLLELINSILDYSKIEAGKFTLNYSSFQLKRELEMLTKSFEYKVQEKNLQFDLQLNFDSSRYVYGDLLRLHQVLINLLNNAIKFSESGSITLRVFELAMTQDYQHLQFEVHDQGIGMEPWQLNGLFQAFNQGEKGSKKRYEGTGLGLAISQKLVQLMGGNIEVESKNGVGSIFRFNIRLDVGDASGNKEISHEWNDIKLKILAVEDNEMNQVVLKYLLNNQNVTIDMADDGVIGYAKFLEKEYDLVLMDLHMPNMDGFECSHLILNSEKYKTRPIPLVALTANAFEEDRRRVLDAGMTGFLTKPIIVGQLENLLLQTRIGLSKVEMGY